MLCLSICIQDCWGNIYINCLFKLNIYINCLFIYLLSAEAEESQSDLNLALDFLRDTYSSELMGYKGIDVNYMLDVIHLSQAPSKSNHFNTTARRKRDVDSLNLYRHLFKRYVDSFINTTQQSNSTNNHTDYYISPTFPPTTTTSYNNRTLPPVPESQGSMADYLLEIAQIFHIISIVVLGIFVLQVRGLYFNILFVTWLN